MAFYLLHWGKYEFELKLTVFCIIAYGYLLFINSFASSSLAIFSSLTAFQRSILVILYYSPLFDRYFLSIRSSFTGLSSDRLSLFTLFSVMSVLLFFFVGFFMVHWLWNLRVMLQAYNFIARLLNWIRNEISFAVYSHSGK